MIGGSEYIHTKAQHRLDFGLRYVFDGLSIRSLPAMSAPFQYAYFERKGLQKDPGVVRSQLKTATAVYSNGTVAAAALLAAASVAATASAKSRQKKKYLATANRKSIMRHDLLFGEIARRRSLVDDKV